MPYVVCPYHVLSHYASSCSLRKWTRAATSSRALPCRLHARAIAASIGLLFGSLSLARDDVPPPQPAPAIVTAKLLRYAQRVVGKYDANQDGRLQADEWRAMQGQPSLADLNHDGEITIEEFAQHIANYSAGRAFRLSTQGSDPLVQGQANESRPAANHVDSSGAPLDTEEGPGSNPPRETRRDLKFFASLPAGVPPWFVERDADGDGQLTLSEFSPKLHKADVDEFNRYDLNHDGIVTVQEYLRAVNAGKSKAARSPSQADPARPSSR